MPHVTGATKDGILLHSITQKVSSLISVWKLRYETRMLASKSDTIITEKKKTKHDSLILGTQTLA